ncbi:MAG: arginase family protein, partial [Pseudomonadota bacterium]
MSRKSATPASSAADAGAAASEWPAIADLLTDDAALAKAALLGAPLAEGSVTPGRCDLAPEIVRKAMKRVSTYDSETRIDLAGMPVFDAGDVDLEGVSPADAFEPLRDAAAALVATHDLTILLGGNNAVTRPGVASVDA